MLNWNVMCHTYCIRNLSLFTTGIYQSISYEPCSSLEPVNLFPLCLFCINLTFWASDKSDQYLTFLQRHCTTSWAQKLVVKPPQNACQNATRSNDKNRWEVFFLDHVRCSICFPEIKMIRKEQNKYFFCFIRIHTGVSTPCCRLASNTEVSWHDRLQRSFFPGCGTPRFTICTPPSITAYFYDLFIHPFISFLFCEYKDCSLVIVLLPCSQVFVVWRYHNQ